MDGIGGSARAIERGYFQEAIARSAWVHQQAVERGERVIVGVNRFQQDDAPPYITVPDFTALERHQRDRLAAARARRDGAAVQRALARLEELAGGPTPLMPAILDAVRARASVGEISDALRRVWGTYAAP